MTVEISEEQLPDEVSEGMKKSLINFLAYNLTLEEPEKSIFFGTIYNGIHYTIYATIENNNLTDYSIFAGTDLVRPPIALR